MPWWSPPTPTTVGPRWPVEAEWPLPGLATGGAVVPLDPLLAVRLARGCVDEAVAALLAALRAEWVSVSADRCRAELGDQLLLLHVLDRLLDDAAVAAVRHGQAAG